MRGAAAVLGMLLPVWLTPRAAHAASGEKILGVGNHLPALEVEDLEGRSHRFDWTRPGSKALIIFFFEPQSAASLKEVAFMDALQRRGRDFGLSVYAVEGSGLHASEIQEGMQKYRRLYGESSFPIIPDPEYALSTLFGIRRLPTSFLLERHGVVLLREEAFEDRIAVDLARKTERFLRVERGFLSSALREIEVSAEAEAELEVSLRTRTAQAGGRGKTFDVLAAGDVVPVFDFTDMNGRRNEWRPSAEGASLTIVFFWGALCRPCIQEMAFLEEVYSFTRERGLDIVAVEGSGLSPERTIRVMERYQRFHPMPSYPVVPDPDYRLAAVFGVKGELPQTFFLDRTGKVIYHTDEFIQGHEESLARKIELALNMGSGSLGRRAARSEARSRLSSDVDEAPSILANSAEEEFRSSLVKGDTYYMNWEFDKALPHYLRCLEIEPNRVTIRERVAKILERQGRLEEALEHWKRVLELEPDHEEALSHVRSLSSRADPAKGAA